VRFTSWLGVRLALALVASIFLVGCGGGGETSSTPPPTSSKVLSWTPPQSFTDQTPLDPAKDLDHYEIYVKETGNFASTDTLDAVVSAVDPASGGLVTAFNIANLAPFLSQNVTYYVSMKSVSVTGVKSGFSPAVSFSL
jgi:hypothetical protein